MYKITKTEFRKLINLALTRKMPHSTTKNIQAHCPYSTCTHQNALPMPLWHYSDASKFLTLYGDIHPFKKLLMSQEMYFSMAKGFGYKLTMNV